MDATLQRLAEAAQSGRSPLYRWLRARHDTFAAMLDGHRPDWRKLAEEFAALGMCRPDGEPIRPATVRACWGRVKRDVAASRGKRRRPLPVVTPVAPPPRPVAPTPAGDLLSGLQGEMDQRSGRG